MGAATVIRDLNLEATGNRDLEVTRGQDPGVARDQNPEAISGQSLGVPGDQSQEATEDRSPEEIKDQSLEVIEMERKMDGRRHQSEHVLRAAILQRHLVGRKSPTRSRMARKQER